MVFLNQIFIVILQYNITTMGVTKSDLFSDLQNELAQQLKAIAHPARISILEYLLKANSCICGDIVNELPLSQPTVSQHLRELKQAGLIKGTIEGKSICYCIDEEKFGALVNHLSSMQKVLISKNKECC